MATKSQIGKNKVYALMVTYYARNVNKKHSTATVRAIVCLCVIIKFRGMEPEVCDLMCVQGWMEGKSELYVTGKRYRGK